MVRPIEPAADARWNPDPPVAPIDAILAPALRKAFALPAQAMDEGFQRLLVAMAHKTTRAGEREC